MTRPILVGARHVLEVERAQRAIVRQARRAQLAPGRAALAFAAVWGFRMAMPALTVVAAWRDAASQRTGFPAPWAYVAVAAVLLGSGHLFQARALAFTAREVLFHPGKAEVLAARLWRELPPLLLTGAAWAAACWLHLRQVAADRPIAAAACCGVALLAPLAWNVGQLLRRLLAPYDRPSLTLALLVAVVVGLLVQHWEWFSGDAMGWLVGVLVAAAGAVLAVALAGAWWRQPRAALRALWSEWPRLSRLVVVVLLLTPAPWLAAGPWLTVAAGVGGASLVACLAIAWRQVLAAVPLAEATPRDGRPGATEQPAVRAPATVHHGRSPWRGAWRRYRFEHRRAWTFLPRHAAGLAMITPVMLRPEPAMAVLAIATGLLAPAFVDAPPSRRLWSWGVDWCDQARQQVLAVLCCAVLPVLLWGAGLATALGWNESRALLLAGTGATFLLRVGWRGFASAGEAAALGSGLSLAAVATMAAAVWLPVVQWATVAPAAGLGLAGLLRRAARWREPELVAARAAAYERRARGGDEG